VQSEGFFEWGFHLRARLFTNVIDWSWDFVDMQIAEKIRKTPGQVLIRWAIQRGVSAIPKSSSPHRIKENMQVFDWKLAAEDFETLSSFQNQVQLLLLQLRNLLEPLLEFVSSCHLSLSIICFPSDPLCPSSQNSYNCWNAWTFIKSIFFCFEGNWKTLVHLKSCQALSLLMRYCTNCALWFRNGCKMVTYSSSTLKKDH
jgi:hypothetical protein